MAESASFTKPDWKELLVLLIGAGIGFISPKWFLTQTQKMTSSGVVGQFVNNRINRMTAMLSSSSSTVLGIIVGIIVMVIVVYAAKRGIEMVLYLSIGFAVGMLIRVFLFGVMDVNSIWFVEPAAREAVNATVNQTTQVIG